MCDFIFWYLIIGVIYWVALLTVELFWSPFEDRGWFSVDDLFGIFPIFIVIYSLLILIIITDVVTLVYKSSKMFRIIIGFFFIGCFGLDLGGGLCLNWICWIILAGIGIYILRQESKNIADLSDSSGVVEVVGYKYEVRDPDELGDS